MTGPALLAVVAIRPGDTCSDLGDERPGVATKGGCETVDVASPEQRPSFAVDINKSEEPPQQRKTVTALEAESRGVPGESLLEARGTVMASADGISRDLSDGLEPFVVIQQIGGDPRGSGHWQTAEPDPLAVLEPPPVEAHVGPARLPARREGELVSIGR
jgi:hypothetical protein